jgi:flagellar motor protein MotB
MPLKKHKEEKFIVPGWMVSFSDMIVNLMCFFILLNSMASSQECGYLGAGHGDYADSVLSQGMPGLMPSQTTLIEKSHPQVRFQAPQLKPLSGKDWVEHTLKTLNEEFDRISRSHSDVSDPGRRFNIPVQLLFKSGVSRLDMRQKEELEHILPSLRSRKDLVEVVGSCADDEVGTMRDALELSFARARAVADYLATHGMPPERLVPSGIGDADFAAVSGESRAQRQRVELRWMLRP